MLPAGPANVATGVLGSLRTRSVNPPPDELPAPTGWHTPNEEEDPPVDDDDPLLDDEEIPVDDEDAALLLFAVDEPDP